MLFFFTPSRVAIVVLTLSLLGFLWSFGLPAQLALAKPSLPLLSHDAPAHTAGEPVQSAPSPDFRRPYVRPDNPRYTPAKPPDEPKPTPAPEVAPDAPPSPAPDPVESKVPEAEGADKDKKTPLPVTSSLPPLPTTTAVNATVGGPAHTPGAKFCNDVRGAPNVTVIVKTSKAEIEETLPTHIQTLLSCVPNSLIFSDHSGDMDGFPVHDVLDTISTPTKSAHGAFEEYEKMKEDPNYKPDKAKSIELDKFKFLPMVYKAHQMHPNSRFYMFIETDTSLSWTNLLQWIDRLDSRIAYYIGAPTSLSDVKFAQRGSGILLSNAAMKQYAKVYEERYKSEWERRVAKECCGDMVLATALQESHVELYSGFPLLQAVTPATVDWPDRFWCTPVVTWRHMKPSEIESIWARHSNWTTENGWEPPYLFRDAFDDLIMPHVVERKNAWDNLSQDTRITGSGGAEKADQGKDGKEEKRQASGTSPLHRSPPRRIRRSQVRPYPIESRDEATDLSNPDIDKAADSVDTCKHLCDITEDCLQWRYTSIDGRECVLGKVIRLGHKVDKKGSDDGYTSGWNIENMKKKIERWTEDCKEPQWRFNQ